MTSDDLHRVIGTLTKISADVLTVELHKKLDNFTVVGFEDMQQVARLNSYVIIPLMDEYIVAEVINIRSKEVNQSASDDSDGTLQRAIAPKYIDVAPMGILSDGDDGDGEFKFGVSTFPPLYSSVLYATKSDLNRIFGVADNSKDGALPQNISIGKSVIFDDYDTNIKIDQFFGGHAAILGNTGSGKSCTVASVLQSIFTRTDQPHATGATFLIFDVNGEYQKAFEKKHSSFPESIEVKKLELDGSNSEGKFTLPYSLLNIEEWELLLQASEKTQRPILRNALGMATLFAQKEKKAEYEKIKSHILATCIMHILTIEGTNPQHKSQDIRGYLRSHRTNKLNINTPLKAPFDHFDDYGKHTKTIKTVGEALDTFFTKFYAEKQALEVIESLTIKPEPELPDYIESSKFTIKDLIENLELAILYAEAHGNKQIRDYCSSLITRTKELTKKEFKFLDVSEPPSKVSKLEEVLGEKSSEEKTKQIIILDMNDVEDEIVELVSAVLARMIFEYLRKKVSPRGEQPVHLVLEEAHRYVAQRPSKYSIEASSIFERIAKEGRKFGMFLMVASQRPSELSKTVLSQCNNFIIHRIQNPEDLIHIKQMTPYISEPVLNRLPSLPQQHALIFGNAVNIPMTFKVRDAKPTPHSSDINIAEKWFPEESS